jgi:GAF domain-containing protein
VPPQLGTFDLLGRGARELSNALGADGCAVSRALGDVLVQVAEHLEGTGTLQLGMGYLISDYPETKAVLESREPRAVSLSDPDADPAEAALLHELRFGSLLMLALVAGDEVWGLVEVYRKGEGGFTAAEVELADERVRRLGDELAASFG